MSLSLFWDMKSFWKFGECWIVFITILKWTHFLFSFLTLIHFYPWSFLMLPMSFPSRFARCPGSREDFPYLWRESAGIGSIKEDSYFLRNWKMIFFFKKQSRLPLLTVMKSLEADLTSCLKWPVYEEATQGPGKKHCKRQIKQFLELTRGQECCFLWPARLGWTSQYTGQKDEYIEGYCLSSGTKLVLC